MCSRTVWLGQVSTPTSAKRRLSPRTIWSQKRLGVEPLEQRRLLAAVTWVGGEGNWSDAANWSSNPSLPGSNDDVTISVPGTVTVTRAGATTTIRSLTCEESLTISAGDLTVTTGASLVNGTLTVTGGSLAANGAAASMTVNGPTVIQGGSFLAAGGGDLLLPQLTDFSYLPTADFRSVLFSASGVGSTIGFPNLTSATGSVREGSRIFIEALNGGRVNLPMVAQLVVPVDLTGGRGIHITVDGATSAVDLPSLTIYSDPTRNAALNLRNGASFAAGALATLTGISVVINNASFNLGSFATITGSSFLVQGGASLSLPQLTSYTHDVATPFTNVTFSADGAGSVLSFPNLASVTGSALNGSRVFLGASNGGRLTMPLVTQITVPAVPMIPADPSIARGVNVTADGSGSIMDLPSLVSYTDPTLDSTLTVRNGAHASAGALATLIGISIVVDNAPETFPGLATITGSSFFARGGASIALPQFTSYTHDGTIWYNPVTFSANGASSVLSLPNLTSVTGSVLPGSGIIVEALAGGRVSMPLVTQIAVPGGPVVTPGLRVTADGAGSVVELTSLSSWNNATSHGSSLRVIGGGTVQLPTGVVSLIGVNCGVSPNGTIQVGTLRLASGSVLTGRGGTVAGNVLNEGLVNLVTTPSLLRIAGSYTQTAAGALTLNLNGATPGTLFDQIIIEGAVSLAGTLTLSGLISPPGPPPGTELVLIDKILADGITGQFAGLPEGSFWTLNDIPYRLSYAGGSGNDLVAVRANGTASRQIFYNNSAWDGNDPAANVIDDSAIVTDKAALLPGGTASLVNYTSFSKGIDGVMVDVANLTSGAVTAADFVFRSGNVNDTTTWTPLSLAPTVVVRANSGVRGSDRISLIWPDGTVTKKWLQVNVLATANTGLTTPDVFYFGNAIGEAGNAVGDAQVNAADELGARGNPRNIANPAPITFLYDYNRDKQVNAADQLISRGNLTNIASRLLLITPTPAAALPDKPAVAHAAQPRGQAPRLADAALVAMGDGDDPLAHRSRKR